MPAKQGMGKMKTYWRDDYRFGNYKGALYAESRPEDALIVEWPNGVKLVFWQEASFVPFIEFPDGMGVTMQFMEGANGSGELFNRFGRMKKNSWPEILGETENKDEFNKILLIYLITTLISFFWILKMILAKRIIFKKNLFGLFLIPRAKFISTASHAQEIATQKHTCLFQNGAIPLPPFVI